MENNQEKNTQNTFSEETGGYTKAPDSQGNGWQNEGGYQQDPYGQQNSYGQQNPYGQQNFYGQQSPYGQQNGQPSQGESGFAIAGMVLGILSLVCCCTMYLAFAFGIVGFALSLYALVKKKPGRGMAIAGLVCSSVAVLFLIFVIIVNFVYGSTLSVYEQEEFLRQFQDAIGDI